MGFILNSLQTIFFLQTEKQFPLGRTPQAEMFSPNRKSMLQAYIDNVVNGHAAVHFSGAGSLQDASLNPVNRPQTKQMTLFVVAKPRTVSSAGQSWLFQGQVGAKQQSIPNC